MTRSSPPPGRGMPVRELVEDEGLGLDLAVAGGAAGLDRLVQSTRIQKSGLALAGHFHGIEPTRIQILGMTEMSFLRGLSPAAAQDAIQRFFERDLCCVIVTQSDRSMDEASRAPASLIACADDSETPLLLSPHRSSTTI
ncbi:MAG: HPr(Ser) kinase/phosphatase, partial [Myxococcales bacterium]|nr:HPr(Ser) kinase/phosphatase [Myxococcales bacterium]